MASLTFSPSLSLSLSFFLHLSPSILYLVPLSGRICINEYLPITQSVLPNAAYVRHDSYPSLLTFPRNHLSVCLNVKVTLFGSQAQWTPGGQVDIVLDAFIFRLFLSIPGPLLLYCPPKTKGLFYSIQFCLVYFFLLSKFPFQFLYILVSYFLIRSLSPLTNTSDFK